MPQIEIGIAIVVGLVLILTSVRILREYERAVVFRLGRLSGVRGPGFVLLIPFWIERMERVSLRTIVQDVTPQDVITRDNVSVNVNAVLSFRVVTPEKAVIEVEDFGLPSASLHRRRFEAFSVVPNSMNSWLNGRKLNQDLEEIIRKHSEDWGVHVLAMEIKHVDLPTEMQRAMAKQAEAERERRAKLTHATGELESSTALTEAATILSRNPISIQLRFLQALIEVAAEKNSTLIFPIPIDLLTPFIRKSEEDKP